MGNKEKIEVKQRSFTKSIILILTKVDINILCIVFVTLDFSTFV